MIIENMEHPKLEKYFDVWKQRYDIEDSDDKEDVADLVEGYFNEGEVFAALCGGSFRIEQLGSDYFFESE